MGLSMSYTRLRTYDMAMNDLEAVRNGVSVRYENQLHELRQEMRAQSALRKQEFDDQVRAFEHRIQTLEHGNPTPVFLATPNCIKCNEPDFGRGAT